MIFFPRSTMSCPGKASQARPSSSTDFRVPSCRRESRAESRRAGCRRRSRRSPRYSSHLPGSACAIRRPAPGTSSPRSACPLHLLARDRGREAVQRGFCSKATARETDARARGRGQCDARIIGHYRRPGFDGSPLETPCRGRQACLSANRSSSVLGGILAVIDVHRVRKVLALG